MAGIIAAGPELSAARITAVTRLSHIVVFNSFPAVLIYGAHHENGGIMVPKGKFARFITGTAGGLLAAALLIAPASAAQASQAGRASMPGRAAPTVTMGGRPSPAGRQALTGTGAVVGTAQLLGASPAQRVCVSAHLVPGTTIGPAAASSTGAAGEADSAATSAAATSPDARTAAAARSARAALVSGVPSASAETSGSSQFLLSGLRPGIYALQYRNCSAASQLLSPSLSALTPPASAARVLVSGGRTAVVSAASLRPAGPAALLAQETPAWLRAHSSTASVAGTGRHGRISGKVTTKSGRPLAGICVFEFNNNTFLSTRTGKAGTYLTLPLKTGRYQVFFGAGCGNDGNWLSQFYKNATTVSKARKVTVTSGHTTRHIDAVMHPGAVVTGTVTNSSGKKLPAICVSVVQAGRNPSFLVDARTAKNGVYRAERIPSGRYRVVFQAGCGNKGNYAPQQYKGKTITQQPTVIRLTAGRVTAHIGARMTAGAQIAGTVTQSTSSGTPLQGICVAVFGQGPLGGFAGFGTTKSDGTYFINGLATGKYQVSFRPGCGPNENVLPETLPGTVQLTTGKRVTGVNGVLQVGGQITGTVTNAATGKPQDRVCVDASGPNGVGEDISFFDGTYTIQQLPTGSYEVDFTHDCQGPSPSLAPQTYKNEPLGFADPVSVTQGQVTSGIDAAMQPGGTISGTTTISGGQKANNICVEAVSPQGSGSITASLQAGRYTIANLAPGLYRVFFFDCGNRNLAAQEFRGGQLISVNAGTTTSGVSAVMQQAGRISGTVSSRAGGKLKSICVLATSLRNGLVSEAVTGSTGRYTVTQLSAGRYSVEFIACDGRNFASTWFRNKSRASAANPVTVKARVTTTGINATLGTGGTISGVVSVKATGKPAPGVCVTAISGSTESFAITGKTGRYSIDELNTGSYAVQYVPCGGGSLAGQVKTVQVTAGRHATGVNEALVVGGQVSGQVLAGAPATGQAAVCVDVLPLAASSLGEDTLTAAGGTFTVGSLQPGSYKVLFGDPACAGPFAPQWYDGQPSQAKATVITVSGGATTNLNPATLAVLGQITGTVTGPGPTALTGVCVAAEPVSARQPAVVAVTRGGKYSIMSLQPGRYRVEFSSGCGASGLKTQWWKNASSKSAATIITVPIGAVTSGINATLHK
jgi:hypothetical protein